MHSRVPNNRVSNPGFEYRVVGVFVAMFATMATVYVASRLALTGSSLIVLFMNLGSFIYLWFGIGCGRRLIAGHI